jgi:hypothetical protein
MVTYMCISNIVIYNPYKYITILVYNQYWLYITIYTPFYALIFDVQIIYCRKPNAVILPLGDNIYNHFWWFWGWFIIGFTTLRLTWTKIGNIEKPPRLLFI